MANIRHATTVTALQSTSLEGKTFRAVESDIGRSLSGSKNDATWAGNGVTDWSAGVHDHKTSDAATIVGTGSDGVWIKHTGFDYDAGETGNISTTVNTANVTLTAGAVVIAVLAPGEPVFLPGCNTTITLSDDGTAAAVEYAILT